MTGDNNPSNSQISIIEKHPIGIGGFDLMDVSDKGFAFDYNSSGKLDHIVFYRPNGNGTIWIIENRHGCFDHVYAEGTPGHGIGGYELNDVNDRAFAFDYNSSGFLDHIVLYNATRGRLWILQRDGQNFKPVYQQENWDGSTNIELTSEDQILAFDYEGSGHLDHLAIYRPGKGTIKFIKTPRS